MQGKKRTMPVVTLPSLAAWKQKSLLGAPPQSRSAAMGSGSSVPTCDGSCSHGPASHGQARGEETLIEGFWAVALLVLGIDQLPIMMGVGLL